MSSIVSDHFILLPPRGTIVEGLLGTRALKSFMLRLNDAQKADRAVAVRAGAARAGLAGTAKTSSQTSNIGPETDLTGPGVYVLSTVPGGYAAMSGTSMACPAVTGMAARMLAKNKPLLGRKRDAARSEAIARLLLRSARPLGFGPKFEGRGLVR